MIRELKTLVAVAREGTFAKAGAKTGLTQAAVSAQIQRLERELGFPLFDRTGRAAHLNKRGQMILLQAQALIRLYNDLGSPTHGVAPTALITIGAIASVQRSLLPEALERFHHQFPQCRTRVLPGVSLELMNMVDAGDIDMAMIIRPPFSLQSDLRWTTLVSEPYRLIVPAHLTSNDWAELLSTQPFIRYDRSSFGGRQVDRFLRQQHFTLNERCELDELDAIVSLVERGAGVALVPETVGFRAWPATVRVIDLGAPTFHRDIGMVHRARQSLSEPAWALSQWVAQAAMGK